MTGYLHPECMHTPEGVPLDKDCPCPIWPGDKFIGPRRPLGELVPCPHCGPRGVPASIVVDEIGHFRVMCGGCGSSSGTRNARMGGDPLALTMAHWNRRYLGDLFLAHLSETNDLLAKIDDDALTPEQVKKATYLHDEALRLIIMVAQGEVSLPSMQYRGLEEEDQQGGTNA
jgi:hypothetical protein